LGLGGKMVFSSIDEALTDLKLGKFVILVDNKNRENEGDLVIAAEKVDSGKNKKYEIDIKPYQRIDLAKVCLGEAI
jgi:hypothetical protein